VVDPAGTAIVWFQIPPPAPMAGYILDFYCVTAKLAVELDGGQHSDPAAKEYDHKRTQTLCECGVEVLRFPDDELLKYSDAVAEAIYDRLISRMPSPAQSPAATALPSPGVPGEGKTSII
jgi:very-short-patch-repair endonuclease